MTVSNTRWAYVPSEDVVYVLRDSSLAMSQTGTDRVEEFLDEIARRGVCYDLFESEERLNEHLAKNNLKPQYAEIRG